MHRTILTVLLAVVASFAMAKKVRTMDRPVWLSSDAGKSLTVTKVEFSDTATVLSFHTRGSHKAWIMIVSSSYLIGDDGKTYAARAGQGITLGEHFYRPESGEADFKVVFEPMPRKTQFVDFIEGPSGWRIWGIHEEGTKAAVPQAPAYDEAALRVTDERTFFRSGKGVVRGRFEGKRPKLVSYSGDDPVSQTDSPKVFDVAADGTFTVELDLDYPILDYVSADHNSYYFYLCPGDTVDMTIGADGSVSYPGGTKNRNLVSLMSNACPSTWLDYGDMKRTATASTFGEYTAWIVSQMDRSMTLNSYIAARFGLTDAELHLLQATVDMYCGYSAFGYESLNKDNSVMAAADYAPFMRRMPYNDLTCLSCPSMRTFINAYQFSPPLHYRKAAAGEPGYQLNKQDRIARGTDSTALAAEGAMLGLDGPSFFLQMTWNNSRSLATDHRVNPERTRQEAAVRRALMTSPYLRSRLDRQMEALDHPQTTARELPEGKAADIFNAIVGKYRGKYVLVDFWSTGCGPCRATIERSQQLRDSLATLPDFEAVFITAEDQSPQKAYDSYVAKNLAGEESYRIPRDDWARLMALFSFNGIPHYELVAPDGKIITTDLNVDYHHREFGTFKTQFEKLKADLRQE